MTVKIEKVLVDGISIESFFTKEFVATMKTEGLMPITVIGVKITEVEGKKIPTFVQISHDSEEDQKKQTIRIASSNPDIVDVQKMAKAIKKDG